MLLCTTRLCVVTFSNNIMSVICKVRLDMFAFIQNIECKITNTSVMYFSESIWIAALVLKASRDPCFVIIIFINISRSTIMSSLLKFDIEQLNYNVSSGDGITA